MDVPSNRSSKTLNIQVDQGHIRESTLEELQGEFFAAAVALGAKAQMEGQPFVELTNFEGIDTPGEAIHCRVAVGSYALGTAAGIRGVDDSADALLGLYAEHLSQCAEEDE